MTFIARIGITLLLLCAAVLNVWSPSAAQQSAPPQPPTPTPEVAGTMDNAATSAGEPVTVASGPQSPDAPSANHDVFLPIVVNSCSGSSAPVSILQNGNFELGTANWTQSAGANPIIGTHSVHWDGSWSAKFGGYNNANDVLYQPLDIPSWATALRLRFKLRGITDESGTVAYDKLYGSLQPISGVTLTEYLAASNVQCNTCVWRQLQLRYNQLPNVGEPLRLYLRAKTDASLITTFYVDDVTVEVDCKPFPAPTAATAAGDEPVDVEIEPTDDPFVPDLPEATLSK